MPIVPNLAVQDLARSLEFYTSVLGMAVTMTVDAEQRYEMGAVLRDAVFATLELDGAQLMLQQVESLAEEVAMLARDRPVRPAGTVYFRDVDPDAVAARLDPASVVKPLEVQWYGMREILFRDPDGHVLCVGRPAEGAAPG